MGGPELAIDMFSFLIVAFMVLCVLQAICNVCCCEEEEKSDKERAMRYSVEVFSAFKEESGNGNTNNEITKTGAKIEIPINNDDQDNQNGIVLQHVVAMTKEGKVPNDENLTKNRCTISQTEKCNTKIAFEIETTQSPKSKQQQNKKQPHDDKLVAKGEVKGKASEKVTGSGKSKNPRIIMALSKPHVDSTGNKKGRQPSCQVYLDGWM